MVNVYNEVDEFASQANEGGLYIWNKYTLHDLGSLEDGELLRLYVDAKTKAEEFEKAHEKFLEYVDGSDKYKFKI